MSNLNVVAIIEAKSDAVDEVRAALRLLVTATRTEEGCVSYDLSESLAAPGTFVAVETWRSEADLDEHSRSPHVQAALGTIGGLLTGAPAIHPLRAVEI